MCTTVTSVLRAESCKAISLSLVGQKWSKQPKFKLLTRSCHRHVQFEGGPEATTCPAGLIMIIMYECIVRSCNIGWCPTTECRCRAADTMSFRGRVTLIGDIYRCFPDTRMTLSLTTTITQLQCMSNGLSMHWSSKVPRKDDRAIQCHSRQPGTREHCFPACRWLVATCAFSFVCL